MATTAQVTHVPIEVYLSSSYEPDAEYVDGVIEERPMGEFDHSSWQHAIELWFAQHAKKGEFEFDPSCGYRFLPETSASPMSLSLTAIFPLSRSSLIRPLPSLRFCRRKTRSLA